MLNLANGHGLIPKMVNPRTLVFLVPLLLLLAVACSSDSEDTIISSEQQAGGPEYSGPPACCSLEMIVSSESEEQATASSSSKGTKNTRVLGLTIFGMSPCPLARLSIWKILVVQVGTAGAGPRRGRQSDSARVF